MNPKLLIVDDDEAIRTQMKWALSQDYEVHFAEDRKGALEAFEANSTALPSLDLRFPPRSNAGSLRFHSQGSRHGCTSPLARRKRHGQRNGGCGDSSARCAQGRPFRRD